MDPSSADQAEGAVVFLRETSVVFPNGTFQLPC